MPAVLVVTSAFPPTSDSGVFRTTKFVKHLPSLGWRPLVLHVRPDLHRPRDATLLDEIPGDTPVAEVGTGPLSRICTASAGVLGRPLLRGDGPRFRKATRLGAKLCQQHGAEVIFVSAPPSRLPLLGLSLAEATGLPLVTDFRDPPWQLNSQWRPDPGARKFFERKSAAVYARSARLIVNTEPVRRAMIDELGLPAAKVVYVPNGYDEDDFDAVEADRGPSAGRALRAVSAGAPRSGPELEALVRALEIAGEHPDFRAEFRLQILGACSAPLRRALSTPRIREMVQLRGHVGHRDSVREMVHADLNVVLLPEASSARRVPQKLYQYLRAGRPVLGFLSTGPGQTLIEDSGLGFCYEPRKSDEMARGLLRAFELWQQGWSPSPVSSERLQRFERCNLTRELADVFEAVRDRPNRVRSIGRPDAADSSAA